MPTSDSNMAQVFARCLDRNLFEQIRKPDISTELDMEDRASMLDEDSEEFYETKEELLAKSVEDMNLSVRARRALGRLSLRTIGEVVSKTEAELLGCKNFGVTSLNEINERLSGYGLSLRTLE